MRGTSPEIPAEFDQRFLVLQTWGFLVPFVWGFNAKWLPVFLGLRPVRGRVLLLAVALNSTGVLVAFAGWMTAATLVLIVGLMTALYSLRLFEPPARRAKVKGVHKSFPVFVRSAYIWALIAASLGIWFGAQGGQGLFRFPGHDGVCNRATGAAGFLRYAIAVQHQTHVCGDSASRCRMSAAR